MTRHAASGDDIIVPGSVAVGADHAGFDMKVRVKKWLEASGVTVLDCGPASDDAVDYPDYAEKVGRAIQEGDAERGVLICGSGAGISIAANKMLGIRASVCHDTYTAHQAVEHDDMNVLCIGSRVIGIALAEDIVQTWLRARFTGEERHDRRVDKVKALEAASR